jgi:carbamoyl-phosphate synthase small subunit
MVGYPESCTDPSYKEQILVFTQPLIGNYGVPANDKDNFGLSKYFESDKIQVKGVIVADYATKFSHWNATQSFGDWLKKYGVYGITGVDTRQLVSVLRDEGTMLGSIANSESDSRIGQDFLNMNMIKTVSHKGIKVYNPTGAYKVMLIGNYF